MGAALAGFMASDTAMTQTLSSTSNAFSSGSNLGQMSTSFDKDKHACKGQNSCKGKGGRKAGTTEQEPARARAAALPTAPSHRLSKRAHQSARAGAINALALAPEFPAICGPRRRHMCCTFDHKFAVCQNSAFFTSPSSVVRNVAFPRPECMGRRKQRSHRCLSKRKPQFRFSLADHQRLTANGIKHESLHAVSRASSFARCPPFLFHLSHFDWTQISLPLQRHSG